MNAPISVVVSRAATSDALGAWDSLVANTPGTDVSQLSAWARVRRNVGYAPLHVFVFYDKRLVAGAQVLYRSIPLLGPVAYVPFGPVIPPTAPNREDICRYFAMILGTVGRHEFRALRVQPCHGGADVSRELLRHGFRRASDRAMMRGSIRLPLDCTEDDLRRQLGKTLRSWTKRWANTGVTVRLGSYDDVGLLVRLMRHTAQHHGYSPQSPSDVESVFRELAPEGHVVLFIGEVHGRPVAADLLTACGGVLKGHFTGFDRSAEARKLRVPGAMRWEAMRWAKSRGYEWFDFGGLHAVTLADLLGGVRDNAMWPNIDRAKVHFGGTPYTYAPAVELIRPRVIQTAYDVLRRNSASRPLVRAGYQLLTRSDNEGRYREELEWQTRVMTCKALISRPSCGAFPVADDTKAGST